MEARFIVLFCIIAAVNAASSTKIKLGFDRPSVRHTISETTTIQCCYSCQDTVQVNWLQNVMITTNSSNIVPVNMTIKRVTISNIEKYKMQCSNLVLTDIQFNDTGLYQCVLNASGNAVLTPGTFLQVYVPIQMVLNVGERSKNSIITAEGVLLLLFVVLPGTMLICKSKGLNELERKKGKEEENIYEGLNLDDCTSTYHQIQRSLVQGPYQDVINSEEEDIQLEKP